jgi:lysophospholipase L1-like esterase
VTPNGLATTVWFEWGTDPSMTAFSSTPTQSAGSGTTSQLASAPLSGLSTGTTYHYRIAASNGSGTTRGSVSSFTPGAAPTATTLSATSVGATGATLNGNVTPNGLATTVWFEWGTDPSMTAFSSTPTQSAGSGTTSQSIHEILSGLDGEATYYFRVVAINSTGDSIGETFSFTTSAPALLPTVSTDAATSITISSADLNGVVNPNGTATNAWFEYGTDPLLSTRETTSSQPVGSGFTGLPFTVSVSGLVSNETYYFRAVASNAGGTQKGAIRSFPTGEVEYFVAVGDSITFGQGDDISDDDTSLDGRNTGGGFEPILNDLLTAAKSIPHNIANEGVGGVDSAYGAAQISTTLSGYPQAKYFLILYGTNDADTFFGGPVTRDDYKSNLQTILSAILAAGKTPYLAKVPFTTNPRYSIASIQEYNAVIDELVAENFLTASPPDFYTLFQNTSLLDADGLHPNGTGYQSMADLWFSALP